MKFAAAICDISSFCIRRYFHSNSGGRFRIIYLAIHGLGSWKSIAVLVRRILLDLVSWANIPNLTLIKNNAKITIPLDPPGRAKNILYIFDNEIIYIFKKCKI